MVTRWQFYDPYTSETYTVPINPNEGGSPQYKKNFLFQNTAAPDGRTLVFQGRPEPVSLDFQGAILTQAHLDAFVTWWNKQNQVRITDDLGRQFWVVITEFSPTRKRASHSPWKHEFSMRATVVDYP